RTLRAADQTVPPPQARAGPDRPGRGPLSGGVHGPHASRLPGLSAGGDELPRPAGSPSAQRPLLVPPLLPTTRLRVCGVRLSARPPTQPRPVLLGELAVLGALRPRPGGLDRLAAVRDEHPARPAARVHGGGLLEGVRGG